MSGYDAVVIGAGHNGLVAAAYLARAGRRTLVLERSGSVGGAAATEELWPGHRVDLAAPYTHGIDRRVLRDLGLARRGLELVAPDPLVASLQPGGPALAIHRDPAATKAAIRRFSERDAARWDGFSTAMARAARALRVLYEAAPPVIAGAERADVFELARLGVRLGRVGRADAVELMRLLPMTVQELLEEWFESDAVLGALGALGCQGIRQGPMAAGTAFVLLHGLVHSETPRWVAWIRGGMGTLGEVLADAAREAGAEIRTDAAVASIEVAGGEARGVVLADGEEILAPTIASAADPVRTLALVDPAHLDPEFTRAIGNIRIAGTRAVVHLAVEGPPPVPGVDGPVAAFCVAPSIPYLERAYDDAKYGRISATPYLEAFAPGVLDPSVAPDGRHVVSAVVQHVPHRLRDPIPDEDARTAVANAAIGAVDDGLPGFAESVVDRQVMLPADLEARFGMTGGHGNHGEMTLDQSFLGRPVPGHARYEMPVGGLFLCGAGAHPGGGLSGAPGANAARAILASRR